MPTDQNPTPITATSGETESILVDGDQVNMDDLFKEVSPGVKPKLTLFRLRCLVEGITHPGSQTRSATPIFLVGSTVSLASATSTSGSTGIQYFEPPHGSTLTKVTVAITAGHTPPAGNKVVAQAFKQAVLNGAETMLGSPVTDTATGSGYTNPHEFDVSCASEVVDRTLYSYGIQLLGESSTGAGSVTWQGSTYTVTV